MTRKPIYLVCGFPRSGTSMMMRALDTGGIPAVFDGTEDQRRNAQCPVHGYVPNPHGFYECYGLHNLWWSQLRGEVVKVVHGNLHALPPEERYAAVYMRRDPEEIKWSYPTVGGSPIELDHYRRNVSEDLCHLNLTLHADLVILDYAAVVANPVREFQKLAHWPIDVHKAAATVDPNLYRHRKGT